MRDKRKNLETSPLLLQCQAEQAAVMVASCCSTSNPCQSLFNCGLLCCARLEKTCCMDRMGKFQKASGGGPTVMKQNMLSPGNPAWGAPESNKRRRAHKHTRMRSHSFHVNHAPLWSMFHACTRNHRNRRGDKSNRRRTCRNVEIEQKPANNDFLPLL